MLDQLKKMNLKHVKVKTKHKKSFKIFSLVNPGCLWGEEERHSFEEVVKRNWLKVQPIAHMWCEPKKDEVHPGDGRLERAWVWQRDSLGCLVVEQEVA